MQGQQIGYIRVSTVDQKTDRQLDGVKLDRVFKDKATGSNTDRLELQEMIRFVREGDTIHVHSLDRLARNTQDLLKMVEDFQQRGVAIKFHKEGLDMSGAAGKMMLTVFAAFATFERDQMLERQAEGIAKAKAKGVYKGGKKQIDRDLIKGLLEEGKRASVIAKEAGCSRAQVYNIKKELSL